MENLFQQKNIPMPVKIVAVVFLLWAVANFLYSILFFTSSVAAPIAMFKGIFSIIMAFGLLNLSSAWRTFTLLITAFGLILLPFYFLGILFSAEFVAFVSELSGIDSQLIMALAIAVSFFVFLWVFFLLRRPDVTRAFESNRKQESLAT